MKKRYINWLVLLSIAFVIIFITKACGAMPPEKKADINVMCPNIMHSTMEKIFSKSKLDKKYNLKFVDSEEEANFIVTEGINRNGDELLAYSPIVALMNSEEQYFDELVSAGFFVKSQTAGDDSYDLAFKKVMDEIIDGKSDFKVYCPSKKSGMWDEFYIFLMITENGGCYPNKAESIEKVKEQVNIFLASDNVSFISYEDKARSNGFAKNTITFVNMAELTKIYSNGNSAYCRVMYPEQVIYHDYYMRYDELGKNVYSALEKDTFEYYDVGYNFLAADYFNNNKYSKTDISNYVLGTRSSFNSVEIPDMEVQSK